MVVWTDPGSTVSARFDDGGSAAPSLPGGGRLLREILDGAPAAVYVYDEDDRFAYVNQRFESIFGRPTEAFLGHCPNEVFPVGVAAELVRNNAAVRRGGRQSFVERVPHVDDGELHVYATEKFLVGAGFVAGISIDVTAEHRASSVARDQDVVLQAIAASTGDMISVHDVDTGRVRWISDGVRELLGYDPSLLVGTLPDDWTAYEDPRALVRRHGEEARAGRPERSVQQVRRADGSETWFEVHTQPVAVPVADDDVSWVTVAITRDVSERHRRERGLEAAVDAHLADLRLYERVLRCVSDPIAIEDLETGSAVFVNSPVAEAMTSRHDDSGWHEGDIAQHVREHADGEDGFARVASRFRHEDGREFPVEILVQRLRHEGRELGVGIARDMSEQETARRQLAAALEREQEATARLLAVDDLRSKMVTGISHEVRTPLTVIHGIAHTLRRGADLGEETTNTLLERLGAATLRLDELLASFLDLGQAQAEPEELHLGTVDLRDEVLRAVGDSDLDGEVISVDVDEVRARVDADKFRRVVRELLDNAHRHSPAGTSVEVRLCRDGQTAVLEVADQGPGIPREVRDRIFEPFERFTQPSDEHSPGVGLGLSVARLYARLHGGSCELVDGHAGGARFRVVLPDVA